MSYFKKYLTIITFSAIIETEKFIPKGKKYEILNKLRRGDPRVHDI